MSETVRVKFLTKNPKYALPQSDFDISTSLNRKGLSDALNQVFELDPPVPFDFKINGNFLRQTLHQAILEYQISTEGIVPIEFFPAFRPPTPLDDHKTEAWISSLSFYKGGVLGSLYDGTIFWNDAKFNYGEGASSPLKCVAGLGDHYAVAGGIDGCVTYFDLENAENHKKFALHNEPIYSIATNKDVEHLFITGTTDGSISMWSTAGDGGSLLSPFAGHNDSVQCLEWNDPNTLISVSLDRTIKFWDVNALQEKSLMTANCGILSVASRGTMLITGHPDRTIKLWDTRVEERKSVVREFKSHTNWVSSVSWITNDTFASGGYDGAVKCWNIGTSIPLFSVSQRDEKIFTVISNEDDLYSGGSGELVHHFKFNKEE